MTQSRYLEASPLLDYHHRRLQHLIARRRWRGQSRYSTVDSVYRFVRDEIRFGYNADDALPASRVLADGYGQCNTKSTLLMALLRALGVPCRLHGFTIDNALQEGAIPTFLFRLAPNRILHSWVEIEYGGRWVALEGFILDRDYLGRIQHAFADQCRRFSGYGIATACLSAPEIDWQGRDTYIQSGGIAEDFGVYDTPDAFYARHGSNLSGLKRSLYRYLLRHLINLNVRRIRRLGVRPRPRGDDSRVTNTARPDRR